MRKAVYFFCLFFVIFINGVKAEEQEYICNYAKDNITTSIKFPLNYQYLIKDSVIKFSGDDFDAHQNIRFYNVGDSTECPGLNCYEEYYLGDIKTLVDYYKLNQNCPPYLLIFTPDSINSDYSFVGILSDKTKVKNNVGIETSPSSNFILELQNDPDDENIETSKEEKEDKLVCQYNLKIEDKGGTVEYKPDITLNRTDKLVQSAEANLVGNYDEFNNIFQNGCSDSVYICMKGATRAGVNDIYIAPNLSIMLNKGVHTGSIEIPALYKDECEGLTDEQCIEEFEILYGYYCGNYNKIKDHNLKLGNGGCNPFDTRITNLKKNDPNETSYISDLQFLKNYCNGITKNVDYSTNKDTCIYKCTHLTELLPSYILRSDKCGISDNLQGWIKNILKFGKFIVPVIVMVFGILDFIKAMSADKDDEMKKAQGRFVKRLIAAALIFIIPFIIEFVLDKMGFAANGCGIIDL